jgi:hypothetical protein
MRRTWPLLLGVLLVGACDITNPPDWTADYLFPLDFPPVDLSGIPGGVIPLDTISFTTPVDSQDTEGLVGRILQSDDLVGLRAEVVLSTNLDVTGDLIVSVAPARSGLFDPAGSLTATIDIGPDVDTAFVPVDLDVFKGAPKLYFQANVLVAGRDGVITVPQGAQIGLRLNFIGTVLVSGPRTTGQGG